jgi:tetratricopeptide (TPR) repeat protein
MKKVIAGVLVLAGLAAAGILANQAVERDREYRRLIVQGDEALSRGQTFSAIEAYSGAIALKSDSMLAYLKRGEAHQRRGGTPETLVAALRDLRTAADLDPSATRTLEELGDVNFQLHRYGNAVEAYEAYLRLDDHPAGVFYKLGLALRGAGRLSRAIGVLRQAIRINPTFHEAHYALGLCLKDFQQLTEARTAFERAVSLSPAFIPAREELAELHRAQDSTREELEQLEALATLDPGRAERLVAVGLAHLRSGRRERAVTTLGLAAERFPDHAAIYAALGRVWLDAAEEREEPSDVRKALEALAPVATQPTASSETLGLYARALMLAGRDAEADQMFNEASRRFPTDPDVLPHYASVAERLGHLDEARQALVRYSVLVDDGRLEAAHAARIGNLSLKLNDAEAAVIWYLRSDALSAGDAVLLARLADAQARAGKTDAARVTAQRALSQDPESPLALAVVRRLQTR